MLKGVKSLLGDLPLFVLTAKEFPGLVKAHTSTVMSTEHHIINVSFSSPTQYD